MQIGLLEKRVNCWAHAIRLIDVQLYLINDKEVRSCIRRDICCVQLSNSESIFNNVEWESSICSCFNWYKKLNLNMLSLLQLTWNWQISEQGRFQNILEQAYLEPKPEPEPEPIGPTLIVRAKRGRPSKADIEARKTLSTTTTAIPNRASKRSKKF